MMALLPTGLLGLVCAALIAAIIASTASKSNSIATIFTLDIYAKLKHVKTRAEDATGEEGQEKKLVLIGRTAAVVAIILAILTARPLRSEEHTSELLSLMRISYAVFCLKKKI